MFKERPLIKFSRLTEVAILAFLVSFAVSLTSPIFPVFAEKIAGSPEKVGLISAVFGLSAIFINLFIMHFFENIGAIKSLKAGLLIFSALFASYFFIHSPGILALSQVVYALGVCLTWTALSILVNNNSAKKDLGDSEGEYFTFMNFGVLLGVLAGGSIAAIFSMNTVFFSAAVLFFITYLLSGIVRKGGECSHRRIESIRKEAQRFFSNAKLRKTYLLNFGLYSWISISFLYFPIILKSMGFDLKSIGAAFAMIVLPYLMLEYPVGELAQKEGSKKFLSLGFFAIAVASLLIYANWGAIYSTVFFFFVSSMGAAIIEPLNEMDVDARSRNGKIIENMVIFKTSLRLSYFLGPLAASALIEFLGMREMFLVLSLIMAGFWLIAGTNLN